MIQKFEKTKNGDKRAELVKEITDKDFLAGIAVRDPDMHVRMQAVDKIDDQTVLSSVAENDGEPLVRCTAVKKVTDQALLEKIAIHDGTNYVRRDAVKGIKDEKLLKQFASRQDEAVSVGAVQVIEDRAFLEGLAMSSENSANVRKAAVRRLKELPGTSRLSPGCWAFSCYDRTRVAGLMLVNPSFYEAENVIRLVREAYSISPDARIEHVEQDQWDAPSIAAAETGFIWDEGEVDRKKNKYLVSHCGFSENQASLTKWTPLTYPNAGLLVIVVNFFLDV